MPPKPEKSIESELSQIIETDRAAARVIDSANETVKYIESQTRDEVETILRGAAEAGAEKNEKIVAAQNSDFAAKKERIATDAANKRRALTDAVEQNGGQWVGDIVARITSV